MKIIVCVIMLAWFASADILQMERWPLLETISKENLGAVFAELEKTVFPQLRHDFKGIFFNNTMTIMDFRITKLVPRFIFMKPTFYTSEKNTFTVTLPLGFHITTEFAWLYNWFVLPVSGSAIMDTDIYDFMYNTTFKFNGPEDIEVKTNVVYSTIKATEIQTTNYMHAEKWIGASELLMTMIVHYYPLLQTSIAGIVKKVLPGIFLKHIPKNIVAELYYPTFHIVFNLNLPLTGITTRDSLLFVFGNTTDLPVSVSAGEKVSRQYCADQGLLNTVVAKAWVHMKGIYGKGDLPKNSVFQLSVSGLSQLIPDVLIDHNKDEEVTLTLTTAPGDPNIKLTKINETHGIAGGFRMIMDYEISGKPVLKITLAFDMVVTPEATRRGTGYAFNMRTLEAAVQKDSIRWETNYKTLIHSNIEAASTEFLTYLILPFLGHTLLGDGLQITDSITPHSVPEFTVTESAMCMNLVRIS